MVKCIIALCLIFIGRSYCNLADQACRDQVDKEVKQVQGKIDNKAPELRPFLDWLKTKQNGSNPRLSNQFQVDCSKLKRNMEQANKAVDVFFDRDFRDSYMQAASVGMAAAAVGFATAAGVATGGLAIILPLAAAGGLTLLSGAINTWVLDSDPNAGLVDKIEFIIRREIRGQSNQEMRLRFNRMKERLQHFQNYVETLMSSDAVNEQDLDNLDAFAMTDTDISAGLSGMRAFTFEEMKMESMISDVREIEANMKAYLQLSGMYKMCLMMSWYLYETKGKDSSNQNNAEFCQTKIRDLETDDREMLSPIAEFDPKKAPFFLYFNNDHSADQLLEAAKIRGLDLNENYPPKSHKELSMKCFSLAEVTQERDYQYRANEITYKSYLAMETEGSRDLDICAAEVSLGDKSDENIRLFTRTPDGYYRYDIYLYSDRPNIWYMALEDGLHHYKGDIPEFRFVKVSPENYVISYAWSSRILFVPEYDDSKDRDLFAVVKHDGEDPDDYVKENYNGDFS